MSLFSNRARVVNQVQVEEMVKGRIGQRTVYADLITIIYAERIDFLRLSRGGVGLEAAVTRLVARINVRCVIRDHGARCDYLWLLLMPVFAGGVLRERLAIEGQHVVERSRYRGFDATEPERLTLVYVVWVLPEDLRRPADIKDWMMVAWPARNGDEVQGLWDVVALVREEEVAVDVLSRGVRACRPLGWPIPWCGRRNVRTLVAQGKPFAHGPNAYFRRY